MYKYKPIQRLDYLVVHCADTKPSMDIGVKEIDRWHRERGWFCCGYHYVIRRNGKIERSKRHLDQPGAHVRGWNHCSLGICLVGGMAEDSDKPECNFTEDQWGALHFLLTQLTKNPPVPGPCKVQGHRDFPKVTKACPTFDAIPWWAGVK